MSNAARTCLAPRRRASHREAATGCPMQTFQSLLAKKISDALGRASLPEAGELTQATDPRFGDYQTNVALVLGKQRGENPRVLAEKIVAHLDVTELCQETAVAGAGFINFT